MKGRQVELVFPSGRVEYDSFGRLLAYVEISGSDFGEMLLRNGLVYPRPEGHPRKARYFEVNEGAKAQRKGMYGLTQLK
ncbi:MAG: thermonuclease family protein [Verrucomicrobia bacterium]|nr:thermonuclease family protein [Verrucomicrobiota bacterium]